MPIYEYRCEECARVTEVIQKLNDRPLRKCEHCSGRLKKLVSRASFHLKGGGWYSEGYSKGESKTTTVKADSETKKKTKPKKKAASA